ncbi:esterase [Flavobacteriaceae bacterium KMM 6898]|nr:esterase [Flavobacteriaceae bacterium KMM 6898]
MASVEKQVTYTISNSYSTLNKLSGETKRVWMVFHGMGHLSTYFIRYFNELNAKENYIIAPQAQSKYYLNESYTHVGASWLTKNNTEEGIDNVLHYIDAVYGNEVIPEHCELIVLGFSQGVSIATRWIAKRKIQCSHLVLYAGSLPNELDEFNFSHLRMNEVKVTFIVGDKDPYVSPERKQLEATKIKQLFHDKANEIIFEGGHEIQKEIINNL